MARQKKPVHRVQMTDGKRNIIRQLLEEYDSVSRMGKAVGKITGRIRPTGTIKKVWRFGGQRGRPTPIGRWNLPADRSALTIAATSGRALIRSPLSIWGQPPAKWKSAASAPAKSGPCRKALRCSAFCRQTASSLCSSFMKKSLI